MIAFLSSVVHIVVSPLETQARLEAEIILLRHQLNVRRHVPSKPKLEQPTDCSLSRSTVCSYRC